MVIGYNAWAHKAISICCNFLFMLIVMLITVSFLIPGLKGQSNKRLISMNEVKQHQKEGSMWTVLKGRVYNISPYMRFHPGGMEMILICSSFMSSVPNSHLFIEHVVCGELVAHCLRSNLYTLCACTHTSSISTVSRFEELYFRWRLHTLSQSLSTT